MGRKLRAMQRHVAVHAEGKAVAQVARFRLKQVIGFVRPRPPAQRVEVILDGPAPLHPRRLATCGPKALGRHAAVVLALQPTEGIARRAHRIGTHVRDAVLGAENLHFPPKLRSRRRPRRLPGDRAAHHREKGQSLRPSADLPAHAQGKQFRRDLRHAPSKPHDRRLPNLKVRNCSSPRTRLFRPATIGVTPMPQHRPARSLSRLPKRIYGSA